MIQRLPRFAERFPAAALAIAVLTMLLLTSCGEKPAGPEPAAESQPAATALPAEPAEPSSTTVDDSAATALAAELTQVVRKYAAEKQRAPKGFEEIVAARYLPSVPVAPGGRKFVIDRNLQVVLQ